jgi:6-phosphogluconate dehydrogenase
MVQGMNIIKAASAHHEWNVGLSELARIWKGGCIIRARFLDRIKSAYAANPALDSLLMDPGFAKDLVRSTGV